jgi:imidazolonepropionase-like amidohydrolase
MTVTGGTIENGSVLIRDGKIAAVGRNVDVPAGAIVIDATGKYVIPGIIDAHSHLAADAINEGSVAVSSMVRIQDVIDPTDINIYRAAAGGVTISHVMHGSANPIGGQNAVIKHRWGADADGLLMKDVTPTIKFALGENPKRSNFGRIPVEARQYQAEWQEYERRVAAGDRNAIPPARDLKLEPLVEVLEGRRIVHSHCYRADEILQLIRVAEEFDFRIGVFQHVLEGYRVADEIRDHGAMASTFSDWWAYKVEAYEAIPHNAAIMTQRGVVVSINSDSPEEVRHLNQEAAKTMKWGGLSEDEALALITLNPAKQLRIDDRVGSIEVGKDADLVIYDNYPLSSYAKVRTTFVDGEMVFDVDRDEAMREQIAAEKERLKEQLGEADDDKAADEGDAAATDPGRNGRTDRKGGSR